MNVKYAGEGKKCTASHSGRPWPSDQALRLVKRNVEDNPRYKASDKAKTVDVNPQTAVGYLHQLGYYGSRDAGRGPLLCPTNATQRKDWAHEMIERLLALVGRL